MFKKQKIKQGCTFFNRVAQSIQKPVDEYCLVIAAAILASGWHNSLQVLEVNLEDSTAAHSQVLMLRHTTKCSVTLNNLYFDLFEECSSTLPILIL